MNEKYKNIDERIMAELKYLNYNLTHIGTKYIKGCIKIDLIHYSGMEKLTKRITSVWERPPAGMCIFPILATRIQKPKLRWTSQLTAGKNYG